MTESTETKNEQTGPETAETRGCGKGPDFSGMFKRFEPSAGASQHFRQARIEFLKGIREMLDHRIEHLSNGPHRGTRITVE